MSQATPSEPGVALDPRRVPARIRRRVLAHVLEQGGLSEPGLLVGRDPRHAVLSGDAPRSELRPAGGRGLPTDAHTPGAYNGPRDPTLDRFFFSPAHYALVLYATLVETGRMSARALDDFNRDGSTVELIAAEHSPGIEAMPGSLPQALSQAGGVALARKLRGEPGRTFVFMSDGEFQEGQTWEAIGALAFHLHRGGDALTRYSRARRVSWSPLHGLRPRWA